MPNILQQARTFPCWGRHSYTLNIHHLVQHLHPTLVGTTSVSKDLDRRAQISLGTDPVTLVMSSLKNSVRNLSGHFQTLRWLTELRTHVSWAVRRALKGCCQGRKKQRTGHIPMLKGFQAQSEWSHWKNCSITQDSLQDCHWPVSEVHEATLNNSWRLTELAQSSNLRRNVACH